MERLQLTDRSRKDGTPRRPGSAKGPKKTPWRGSDPTPKDTWRNNYLENEDEVTKVNKLYVCEFDLFIGSLGSKLIVNPGAEGSRVNMNFKVYISDLSWLF